MATGRRSRSARASPTVDATSSRYRTTSETAKPGPDPRRPPKDSETTRPSAFMPSSRPHRQSLLPITGRPRKAVEYTTRSHRSGE